LKIIQSLEKENVINALLIDPSRGRGVEFDTEVSVNLFNKLKSLTRGISIGFAGGLTPENVNEKIIELKKKLRSNKFSLDVESGIRNEKDELEIRKVRKYIYSSLTALYL
jgi:phosphoribosylanthranilate isomerase